MAQADGDRRSGRERYRRGGEEHGATGEFLVGTVAVDGPSLRRLRTGSLCVLEDGGDAVTGLLVIGRSGRERDGLLFSVGETQDQLDAGHDKVPVRSASEALAGERRIGENLEENATDRPAV